MSTKAHTTVQLGDMVVVAFDWARQRSSDPREAQILGAKAVSYLLQRARRTSPSRPPSGPLRSGSSRRQPVLEDAGRLPGGLASPSG